LLLFVAECGKLVLNEKKTTNRMEANFMTQTRVIQMDNESGSYETVVFTEDIEKDASDFCSPGQTVISDSKIDEEMPSGFPMDYVLRRV
jgi:hypothetical protein